MAGQRPRRPRRPRNPTLDWEVPPQRRWRSARWAAPRGWWGNQPAFPDIGSYGNHEYGHRVGIFRLLAVLDKYGITPTRARPAVADHYQS
jgi:hypothetical protein